MYHGNPRSSSFISALIIALLPALWSCPSISFLLFSFCFSCVFQWWLCMMVSNAGLFARASGSKWLRVSAGPSENFEIALGSVASILRLSFYLYVFFLKKHTNFKIVVRNILEHITTLCLWRMRIRYGMCVCMPFPKNRCACLYPYL